MKLKYHLDTDSLYIDLTGHSSVESREISEGVVLDYDATGRLVGIDIDNASRKVQLERLELSGITSRIEHVAGQATRATNAWPQLTQMYAIALRDLRPQA